MTIRDQFRLIVVTLAYWNRGSVTGNIGPGLAPCPVVNRGGRQLSECEVGRVAVGVELYRTTISIRRLVKVRNEKAVRFRWVPNSFLSILRFAQGQVISKRNEECFSNRIATSYLELDLECGLSGHRHAEAIGWNDDILIPIPVLRCASDYGAIK